jgi:hypothetical protein
VAALNKIGRGLNTRSVVPLTVTSLTEEAMRSTGLRDFGDDDWAQHLGVLLESVEREADLHLAGRLLTRTELLMYLEARLSIIERYRRFPPTAAEVIDKPVLITGYGRSGTTILFELLSQDPQFRVARKWESLFPCPPPEQATYHCDARIRRAEDFNMLFDSMLRWLMKSPSHLPHLAKLLRVFPDMKFIFAHRDPLVCADSVVSFLGTLYWLRTDNPWGGGSEGAWALRMADDRAGVWDDILDLLETGKIANGNHASFHYDRFMVDPIAAIQRVYDDLQMTLSPGVAANMQAYLDDRSRGKFDQHVYARAPPGTIAAERKLYERYQEYFGVRSDL